MGPPRYMAQSTGRLQHQPPSTNCQAPYEAIQATSEDSKATRLRQSKLHLSTQHPTCLLALCCVLCWDGHSQHHAAVQPQPASPAQALVKTLAYPSHNPVPPPPILFEVLSTHSAMSMSLLLLGCLTVTINLVPC